MGLWARAVCGKGARHVLCCAVLTGYRCFFGIDKLVVFSLAENQISGRALSLVISRRSGQVWGRFGQVWGRQCLDETWGKACVSGAEGAKGHGFTRSYACHGMMGRGARNLAFRDEG